MSSCVPPDAMVSRRVEAAERVVAACAMLGPDEADDARELVRPADFASHGPRLVFDAVCAIRDAGRHVDLVAVHEHLVATGQIADLGHAPAGFLADLAGEAPTAANLAYYAGRVREASKARAAIRAATEFIRDAADAVEPADDTIARLESRLADATAATADRGPVPIGAAVREAFDRYDRLGKPGSAPPGVPTGLAGLDRFTGGLVPGQLVILAARPSVGKSALALRITEGAALSGAGVLFFSLEMPTAENVDRLIAGRARVKLDQLRGVAPIEDTAARRVAGEGEPAGLAGLPIYFDDRPVLTASALAATARRWVRREGVRVVVTDYLQLLRPENPREPRYLQVGQSSKRLKQLAREAGVAVLCLAQLNREVEARGDGKPRLADLRDSGEIEQDADAVLMLHPLDSDPQASTVRVDLIVAKNRNGAKGTVPLEYLPAACRFEQRAPDDPPAGRREWRTHRSGRGDVPA